MGAPYNNKDTAQTERPQDDHEPGENENLPRRTPTPTGSPERGIENKTEDTEIEMDECLNTEVGRENSYLERTHTRTRLREQREKIKKNMRANIKLGTLNIQGRGATTIYNSNHKWNKINRLMRTHRLSILAVQETHLDEDQT